LLKLGLQSWDKKTKHMASNLPFFESFHLALMIQDTYEATWHQVKGFVTKQ
jgi:hypothetical protein